MRKAAPAATSAGALPRPSMEDMAKLPLGDLGRHFKTMIQMRLAQSDEGPSDAVHREPEGVPAVQQGQPGQQGQRGLAGHDVLDSMRTVFRFMIRYKRHFKHAIGKHVDHDVVQHILPDADSAYGIRTTQDLMAFLDNPQHAVAAGKCAPSAAEYWASASEEVRSAVKERLDELLEEAPDLLEEIDAFKSASMLSYADMLTYYAKEKPESYAVLLIAMSVCMPEHFNQT